jgi:tetratricopeptide (TPR) repeat protein
VISHNGSTMRSLRQLSLIFGLAWATVLAATAVAASEEDSTASPALPAASDAGAEITPSPEALVDQGIELRKRGDDRLALAAFERAWQLGGSGQALAQLALAEQALGRWLDAYEHLEAALLYAEDAWILGHRQTLEGALKEITSRLGALEITCNLDGAEVRLDGRLLGRTPLRGAVRVVAGESVIRMSAQGYFDVARQVQVDAGGLARLDVTLTPSVPVAVALTGSAAGNASQSTVAGSARVPPMKEVSAALSNEAGSSVRDTLLYSSLGLAGLGLSAGVTGYVIREVNVKLYNDDERCSQALGVRRSDECGGEAAAWRSAEIISVAGFSTAGVFGLMALYLWLDRPPSQPDTRLACGIGMSTASIACSGQF